jgi:hypothetical protein
MIPTCDEGRAITVLPLLEERPPSGARDSREQLQSLEELETLEESEDPKRNLESLEEPRERWSHFLGQLAKVDSPMRRMNHHEDAETVFG